MATTQSHPQFTSRVERERESALCNQYRPVGIGAVAAAKCIRKKEQEAQHDNRLKVARANS